MNIGRYEVVRELGRGGMGVVYLAYDARVDRNVAIKHLAPHVLTDRDSVARFQREARIVARLEHASIVPIYDFGEDEGHSFLVMRYMPGGSLADRVPAQVLTVSQAVDLLQPVADALDFAHGHGVIHRDVKPANILFDAAGRGCLSDFGIAKFADATTITTSLAISGTAHYMSPEQARGDPLTPASDVYSLGVVAFELLTGRVPFVAENAMGVMFKQVNEPAPSPRLLNPALSVSAESAILRALAKTPAERFQSPRAFVQALGEPSPSRSQETRYVSPGMSPVPPANRPPVFVVSSATPQASPPRRSRGRYAAVGFTGALIGVAIVGASAFAVANLPDDGDKAPQNDQSAPNGPSATVAPTQAQTSTVEPTSAEQQRLSLTGQWVVSDNVTRGPGAGLTFTFIADVVDDGSQVQGVSNDLEFAGSPNGSTLLADFTRAGGSGYFDWRLTDDGRLVGTYADFGADNSGTSVGLFMSGPASSNPTAVVHEAEATVLLWYSLLELENFDAAYGLWSNRMQSTYDREDNIDNRWAQVDSIEIHDVQLLSATETQASVHIDFTETTEAGSSRRMAGQWDLVLVDGEWRLDNPAF